MTESLNKARMEPKSQERFEIHSSGLAELYLPTNLHIFGSTLHFCVKRKILIYANLKLAVSNI